ncbi:MAG: hypothetical protein RL301_67 [Actinomycetota bacterium]|jgi:ribosome-binding factor A
MSVRSQKVADRIKVVVAEALESKVKDPRLGFVTITDVRITGDLQNASVFYTVLGDNVARENTAKALNSAKGLLRTAVGRDLGTRITPTLEFFEDSLPETSVAMESLLADVKKHDEEISALSAKAKPIAEDAYKKPKTKSSD